MPTKFLDELLNFFSIEIPIDGGSETPHTSHRTPGILDYKNKQTCLDISWESA